MDGQTYDLEFVRGECVPKRCPVETVLKQGRCIAISATASAPATEATTNSASKEAKKPADDGDERHHVCAHGMVHTHAGCVSARRRSSAGIGNVPAELQRYYHSFALPGN
jgi:hypothetical protein